MSDGEPDETPPTADIIYASSEMKVESLLEWPVFRSVQQGPQLPLIAILGQNNPEAWRSSSTDVIYDIDPGAVRSLVSNFLSTNHTKNPVLDIEMLWADVRDIVENGPKWDGKSCLVV